MRILRVIGLSSPLSLTPAAFALEILRDELNLAPTACKPALPVYSDAIRPRPIAIQNKVTTMLS